MFRSRAPLSISLLVAPVLLVAGPLLANPIPVGEAIWLAEPPTAPSLLPIALILGNQSVENIELPDYCPWVIKDAGGAVVYDPVSTVPIVLVPPGGVIPWEWDQRDDLGNPVPAGSYVAELTWRYEGGTEWEIATAPIAVIGGIQWTVTPDPVLESESLTFTVMNDTGETFELVDDAPWYVTDLDDVVVHDPGGAAPGLSLGPGVVESWTWDPPFGLAPGDYRAYVEIRDATGSIELNLRRMFTIVPSAGRVVWRVRPPVNPTRSYLGLQFTNATTSSVDLRDTNPWWIERSDGTHVFAPITHFTITPVPPFTSRAWCWGEVDDAGSWVGSGWYRAKIKYDPLDGSGLQELSRTFRLFGRCWFLTTDRYQYAVGETVNLAFENCWPETIGMPCTEAWWIATAFGLPVYTPICAMALTQYEPGEGFLNTWDQTDLVGQQVPEGIYQVCALIADGDFRGYTIINSLPFGIGEVTIATPEVSAGETGSWVAPNPLATTTTIAFRVDTPAPVVLRVFDGAGRLVNELDLGIVAPGEHHTAWDAVDTGGRALASGAYHGVLRIGDRIEVRKLVVVR